MKYLLIEESAAQEIVTRPELQSIEYKLCKIFVSFIKGEIDTIELPNIYVSCEPTGAILSGKEVSNKFILFDFEQCHLLENTSEQQLLLILQKVLRFAIRYWSNQVFTPSENIVGDKAVIFPFPFSSKMKAYRIAIAREPECPRLTKRGISSSLLAYKYNDKGAPKGPETPKVDIYQKAGEAYIDKKSLIRGFFSKEKTASISAASVPGALYLVGADSVNENKVFKFLSLEKQRPFLTESQRRIVDNDDVFSPIRIEGPAGTGKTMAMIMRAARLLKKAREEDKELKIIFLAHSRTTQATIEQIFCSVMEDKWENDLNQSIKIITLQEYCAQYVRLSESQIIDGDAYDAKQFQLQLIQEVYSRISEKLYPTYRPHLSERLREFLDTEEPTQVVFMLQHEFSIQIKGYAAEDFDVYKILSPLTNGLPVSCGDGDDKEYIFRIFNEYQDLLKRDSVFDTDDVVLEAISRFKGPLWKRERRELGYSYIFVDEMHMFNLNEQMAFHYLTQDITQESVPICFALDYSQAIGDRGDINRAYIEKNLSSKQVFSQELSTVFRSSQQIAELCAAITSSGATLFDSFINPYVTAQSGFTAKEESYCKTPTMFMYPTDERMLCSLKDHVERIVKEIHCRLSDIAIVSFLQDETSVEEFEEYCGKGITELISRNNKNSRICEHSNIVLSTPENINGLEFSAVILVGVDDGRVPLSTVSDISENFMRFRALNQLYLSCSRAKYQVCILGNNSRGISNCLNYALASKTLRLIDVVD